MPWAEWGSAKSQLARHHWAHDKSDQQEVPSYSEGSRSQERLCKKVRLKWTLRTQVEKTGQGDGAIPGQETILLFTHSFNNFD